MIVVLVSTLWVTECDTQCSQHTWSVQRNIPGLYNKTYLVLHSVCICGCQQNKTHLVCTTKHTYYLVCTVAASTTKHTWFVQWLPAQQQNIPCLYSDCQHNNKTYLVCTECASLAVEAEPSGHCCPTWLDAAGWWCSSFPLHSFCCFTKTMPMAM